MFNNKLIAFLILFLVGLEVVANEINVTQEKKLYKNALYTNDNNETVIVIDGEFCHKENNKMVPKSTENRVSVFNVKGTTLYPTLQECVLVSEEEFRSRIVLGLGEFHEGEVREGSIWTNLETNLDGIKDLQFSMLGKNDISKLNFYKLNEKTRHQNTISEFTKLPIRPDEYRAVDEEQLWVKANYRLEDHILYSIYCHGQLGDYGYYDSDCGISNDLVGSYLYNINDKTSVKIRSGMPLEIEGAFLINDNVVLYGYVIACKSCGFNAAYSIKGKKVSLILKENVEGT